jgi:anhydro-N-acetylmuramic acid kinase
MTLTRALGLMSGTSMDGVDVALVETDGGVHVKRGPFASYPYDSTRIVRCCGRLSRTPSPHDRA